MRICKCILSFAMVYGSWVQAAPENFAEKELNSLVAQRVADRMSRAKDFSDFFADLKIRPRVGDMEWLNNLDHQAKTWPKLAVGGGKIEIMDGAAKIVIGIKNLANHEITINGLSFQYDSKRDLRPQLHELFRKQAARQTHSSSVARVMNLILPQAHAMGPLGTIGLMEITSGNVAQGTLNMAIDSALESSSAAGAAGGAGLTVTAGGVAITAGIVLALAAAGYAGLCYADSGVGWDNHYSSDRFKNCLTAPLSLLGLNWRDQLFPSHISCPGTGHNYFEIDFASKTGLTRKDNFVIDEEGLNWYISREQNSGYHSVETRLDYRKGALKKVSIHKSSLDSHSDQKLDPSAGTKLLPYQKIGESSRYFVELCKDPKRVATVNELLDKGAQVPAEKLQTLDKSGAVK